MATKVDAPRKAIERMPRRTDLLDMYYTMLLARAVSERMWVLFRQGQIPLAVTGEGHEAAQVGSAYVLKGSTDWLVPYYRDIASVLVRGMSARDIMLGAFARAADPSSGGRQMPCHFSSRRLRILSGSSAVATQIPHAVGIALAAKIKGEPTVTLVCFGDGATSRGEFHAGLNFAGVHRLPVVFLCENNAYAISVPFHQQVAGGDIAIRAKGYGFPGVAVDGTDVLAVYEATKDAVEQARAGGGPTLIETKVYRFRPHTSNDDDSLYRTQEEVQAWLDRDPIILFERFLEDVGFLSASRKTQLRAQALKETEEAGQEAMESALPRPEDALHPRV